MGGTQPTHLPIYHIHIHNFFLKKKKKNICNYKHTKNLSKMTKIPLRNSKLKTNILKITKIKPKMFKIPLKPLN